MPKYAKETEVSIPKSQQEVQTFLARYGATNYAMGMIDGRVAVMFEAYGRRIRLALPIPELSEDDLYRVEQYSHRKVKRTDAQMVEVRQQRERQLWRILVLIIKGKLEIIETGAVSFEDEWLPYTMLPDGSTVSEWMEPQMARAANLNQMPPLMPGVAPKSIELGERSGT